MRWGLRRAPNLLDIGIYHIKMSVCMARNNSCDHFTNLGLALAIDLALAEAVPQILFSWSFMSDIKPISVLEPAYLDLISLC